MIVFTADEWAKLPKWAREKLAILEQKFRQQEDELNTLRQNFEGQDVFAWVPTDGLGYAPIAARTAGLGAIKLGGSRTYREEGWRVQVSADGTELEIFSPWNFQGLNILPHVSNHITVRGNYDGC